MFCSILSDQTETHWQYLCKKKTTVVMKLPIKKWRTLTVSKIRRHTVLKRTCNIDTQREKSYQSNLICIWVPLIESLCTMFSLNIWFVHFIEKLKWANTYWDRKYEEEMSSKEWINSIDLLTKKNPNWTFADLTENSRFKI